MKHATVGDSLVIFAEGRWDANAQQRTESEIMELMKTIPAECTTVILDMEKLTYISSSGLRILLMLKNTSERKLQIRNVSMEVYDILQMTGITELLEIFRKPRTISIEGCELIGSGGMGDVYCLNPDTIVKVYRCPEDEAMAVISREHEKSRIAFTNGIPTVQRNAYGGGEGGAVFGTAHLKMINGYVGYQYNESGSDDINTEGIDERYEEKIQDETKATPNTFLTDAGCLFGGGYIDNSSVDKTKVSIYGGHVRGSAFGGGEVAAIGRGDMKLKEGSSSVYELKGIYRPGKTDIEMFGGHIHRNVYGGGRGVDNLGGHGSLNCDGYVFGQTEVHIHGGEIGTSTGVEDGNGNVFGGGDEGYVYSAYEDSNGHFGRGVKAGKRYNEGISPTDEDNYNYQGYYYKHLWYDDESTGSNIDSKGFFTVKNKTKLLDIFTNL